MRKECIKLGLSGRFTMKEALVELAAALVRLNKDPKSYHFYPSQPLLGYFPYQVVILTDIVETMRVLPTSMSTCSFPSTSVTTSSLASSTVPTGVTSSASAQVPLCASVPFFSPNYPPPTSSNSSPVKSTQESVSEKHVLEKILNTVEKIHNLMERAAVYADNGSRSDSEFESFSSATMSSSSKMSSQIPETCRSVQNGTEQFSFLPSSTSCSSQSSIPSSRSYSTVSGNMWSKSFLREESICIKFQHGSCKFADDHPGNSHLCAKCYTSYDELLEPGHGADRCPNY